MEEAGRTRREKEKKETDDRGGKNNGRKGGRSEGFNRIESDR